MVPNTQYLHEIYSNFQKLCSLAASHLAYVATLTESDGYGCWILISKFYVDSKNVNKK